MIPEAQPTSLTIARMASFSALVRAIIGDEEATHDLPTSLTGALVLFGSRDGCRLVQDRPDHSIIGTQGLLGESAFVYVLLTDIPPSLHQLAEIEFANKELGGSVIKQTVSFTDRC
jgi:hypothetical protein